MRVLLVAAAAALIAAPAVSVASARSGNAAPLLTEQSPAPTPTATEIARTSEPTRTPEATRSAGPTRSAEPTPTPAPTSTAKPTTAPKPPTSAGDEMWELLVRYCLESRTLQTDACLYKLSISGISLAEFKAKLLARLEEIGHAQASRGDLEALLHKCVESNALDSDACMKAWKLSGLTLEDFKAMILKKLGSTTTAKPLSELELAIRKCVESKELYGAECYHAYELSGLSSEEFDRKIKAMWGQK